MKLEHPYRRHFSKGWIAAAGLILVVCMALPAHTAQSFLPDSIQTGPIFTVNDPTDTGGTLCQITACSLRAAIDAANAGSLPGGYIITFDLTYPAQIDLASSLPDITGEIDIIGPGKTALSINGGGLVRIFTVLTGASLDLAGISLTRGWNGVEGGGAIRNGGILSITNAALTDNLAGGGNGGGLLNDPGGDVLITNTAFLNNRGFHDGAIANSGSITIRGSTFSGNRARVGGAIQNYTGSSMTITGSAFTDNVANISSGGAIANGGELIIANSTFYQNGSPNGADIVSGNKLYVTNSTFFGAVSPSFNSIAGGGAGSTIVLYNNILAAETGIANCDIQAGSIYLNDSNLSTDDTCSGADLVTLDQLKLAPLVEIAGVPGLLLLPGSTAIDTGNDTICAAAVGAPDYGAEAEDQRGLPRPVGAHCDVGAFEFLPPILYLPYIVQ